MFKELLSTEIYIRWALMISNHVPYEYFELQDNFASNIIKYRPDQIAIEKYIENFMSNK